MAIMDTVAVTPGWEWAAWEYRDAIEQCLGRELPNLSIIVGEIRKPQRISRTSERCVAFFLTEEILHSIARRPLGAEPFAGEAGS